ncbi:hypothetical protein [Microcoleus sp. D2_18a_D3]|uniref:hypothetical protein n=1 Tax=Microcoleus sp. D2_18a_D3 TaxID=3055330 RepID=UPI002FCF6FFC
MVAPKQQRANSTPSTRIPNPEAEFIETRGGLMRRGVCVVGFLMSIDPPDR